MIAFDAETKVFDIEVFSKHNIADLNSGITFILFSQEKPLGWKGINTKQTKNTEDIKAFSKPSQSSKMESFADVVNSFLSLNIFTKSFILDVRKSSENASSKQV